MFTQNMRVLIFIFLISLLIGCRETDQRESIIQNLSGSWTVSKAVLDKWGSGPGGKFNHEYNGNLFLFNPNGEFEMTNNSKKLLSGSFKVQPGAQSNYELHLNFRDTNSLPLKKELWYISYGRGKRIRVNFDNEEGTILMILNKE